MYILFVSGGAKGAFIESNSPNRYAHANIFGLARDVLKRFKVMATCVINMSHLLAGKSGSRDANPALK